MILSIFKNRIQTWLYTVSVILLSLALQSCEKKKIEPTIDTFPMNQGSEWHYQRAFYITEYKYGSPDKVVDADTFYNAYKLWVSKDTVLNDTMQVSVFESFEKGNLNFKGQQYYYMDEEGLKLYATKGSTGPIVIGKSATGPDNDPAFSMGMFMEFLPSNQTSEFHYLIPPRISFQFPLEKDGYWTCIQGSSPRDWRIDKKVAGTELLKIGEREFFCFRVEWLYFDFVDNADIHATEWIAKEGLIQRIVEVARQDLVNPDGTYHSNIESKEVLQLVDLNLN